MKINMRTRILSMLVTACLVLISFPLASVLAEDALSLSVSGNQEVGSSVTVSAVISGSGPYSGFDGSFTYDDKLLSLTSIAAGNFDAANFKASGSKFLVYNTTIPGGSVLVTATFSCIAIGTAQVNLQLNSLGDMNGQEVSVSSVSTSINISEPVLKSSNAKLASLTISPGTLSPSFAPDVFQYSAQASSETTQVTVSASAQDAKATITLNGVQNKLVAGKNSVKITVTAEDGSVRIYTIDVMVTKGPTPTPTPTPVPLPLVYINGASYTILTAGSADSIPEGFIPTTVSYSGVEVPALVRNYGEAQDNSELVLLYLTNDSDTAYFVYDRLSESFHPFVSVQTLPEVYIYAGKAPETMIPVGYEPFAFLFHDIEITAYRLISEPNHLQCLIFLMSSKGVSSFYTYDQEMESFIPYRGQVLLLTPTPTPTMTPTGSPVPTLPTVPSTTSAASIYVEQNETNDSASTGSLSFSSLLDYKNPVVLLFYLLCLIIVVLVLFILIFFKRKFSLEEDDDFQEISNNMKPTEAILFSKQAKKEKRQSNRVSQFSKYEDPDYDDRIEIEREPVPQTIIRKPKANQAVVSQKDMPLLDYPTVYDRKSSVTQTNQPHDAVPVRPGNSTNSIETKKPDTKNGLLFGDPDEE